MQAIIMIGPSGSGKSTWIKNNLEDPVICSSDSYFTNPSTGAYEFDPDLLSESHAASLRKFVAACQRKNLVVVSDNTNTTMAEIAPYIAIAKAYRYEVRVVVCGMHEQLDLDLGLEYAEKLAARNSHGVPAHIILRHLLRMQDMFDMWPYFWPDPEEA
jgi:predicted kinase